MLNRRLPRSPRHQRGGVAIIVGLTMALMIGFAGLALDGGRLYVNKTELQNAADACALAAAYELTGSPSITQDSFNRANNAGLLIAQRNRRDFQRGAVGVGDVTIEFGTALNAGAWLTAAANPGGSARFVRCTIANAGIAPWFMQVVGFGSTTVRSAATASLARAQGSCGIPLAMCMQSSTPPYGLVVGRWYRGPFDPGGGATGDYKWIDFTPPGSGANEVRDLLTGSGVCNVTVGTNVGQSGSITSAVSAWNTRFGLYTGSYNATNAPPDFTGFAYTATSWPAQADAINDFVARRSARAPYQGDAAAGFNPPNKLVPPNSVSTVAQHTQYGASRRLATSPIINCAALAGGSHLAPIVDWACILMLSPAKNTSSDQAWLEFRGLASDVNSPCATSGVVGNSSSMGPLVPALVQ